MNDSPLDAHAKQALIRSLNEKVARLVEQRAELAEKRMEILTRQRQNDRELADCRATARLFNLNVPMPPPDREAEISMREREMLELDIRRRAELDTRRLVEQRNALAHGPIGPTRVPQTLVDAFRRPAETPALRPPAPAKPSKPPTLKNYLLQRLAAVGAEGAKAAALREAFERISGQTIHEKTVGMTLYRMSKDNLVKRDGHTWFIAAPPSPEAETVNPGVAAPGSVRPPE